MPHPEQLPAGFSHWPHIRRLPVAVAAAIIAESDTGSTYDIAAEYGAVLIGSSASYHYFLVNRPVDDAGLIGDFVADAYNDLSVQIRGVILEAEYETEQDGAVVTMRCKENAVPEGVTPTATGLIPSWVAGLPLPVVQ